MPYIDGICSYSYINDAIDDLGKDIERANRKIVVSFPDSWAEAETQDKILSMVKEAARRGIRHFCKTNQLENLSDEWKRITKRSENVLFPMIVIDDQVARVAFQISNRERSSIFSNSNSTYHIIYRLEGENTLKMLKTLTDIEYCVKDDKRKALVLKGWGMFPNGLFRAPVDAYCTTMGVRYYRG